MIKIRLPLYMVLRL